MTDNPSPLVLVIDDMRDIRDVVQIAMQYEGWRVLEAADGRQGLEFLRAQTPDLILVDLMMPEMSGIEFCRKLIEDCRLRDVPVLMISGVSEGAKILNDFWEMPLRHKNFLRKPFSTEELIRCVQGIMPRFKAPRYPSVPQQPGKTPPPPTPAPARPAAPSGRAGTDNSDYRRYATEPLQPEPAPGLPPASSPTPPPWLSRTPSRPATPPPDAQPPRPQAAPQTLPAGMPTPPTAEERRSGYRILTIDDEDDICEIMKAGLGLYHVVETAANGMEGLETLDQFLPDIVITDINMPVMNGLETAEAIRRHPLLCRVPIFFLTGETDQSLPRKTYDLGGNLYLRKPVDPLQLIKFIDLFVKETGLEPAFYKKREAEMRKQAEAKAAARPAAPPAPVAVRILVADYNIEQHYLLKRLLESSEGRPMRVAGGPFDVLWTENATLALGNLARWEPDLILYNSRNPGMDGVAFGQMLALQKMAKLQEVAYIGTRFFNSDVEYSRNHFHRGVIELDQGEDALVRKLSEATLAARQHIRAKRFTFEEINAEEVERLRQIHAQDARQARERETLRQRYAGIQQFIDQQMK